LQQIAAIDQMQSLPSGEFFGLVCENARRYEDALGHTF
jgi:hypothetical protein